jgi:hypothetical protein
LLYNERTKRIIDGHARKKISKGKVPMLIGDWSEEDERKILATLDPLTAMAEASEQALSELLSASTWASDTLQEMLSGLAPEPLPDNADGQEFDESCANDVKMITCPKCGHGRYEAQTEVEQ